MARARTGTLTAGTDGIWRAHVSQPGPDGKPTRRTVSLGTTSETDARRKLAKLAADDLERKGGA
jgi:hypothetical protein